MVIWMDGWITGWMGGWMDGWASNGISQRMNGNITSVHQHHSRWEEYALDEWIDGSDDWPDGWADD